MPVDHAAIRLERVVDALPAGFPVLCAAARAEGFGNLDRLGTDWESGRIRFEQAGEGLMAAYLAERLAGIGGLTVDPALPDALRMRRFYVAGDSRRRGIGRRLAVVLLALPDRGGRRITVNAAPVSWPFWQSLGFVVQAAHGHTHLLWETV